MKRNLTSASGQESVESVLVRRARINDEPKRKVVKEEDDGFVRPKAQLPDLELVVSKLSNEGTQSNAENQEPIGTSYATLKEVVDFRRAPANGTKAAKNSDQATELSEDSPEPLRAVGGSS